MIVWKLGVADESAMSTTLPLDPSPEPRPKPWILYMLSINTMNFCSFSHCPASPHDADATPDLLVAVPNTLFSEAVSPPPIPIPRPATHPLPPQVDIFHLPTQERRHTVRLEDKGGMVMALAILHLQDSTLTLLAGYENGVVAVAQLLTAPGPTTWSTTYHTQPHSQPVLSLALSPRHDYFLTSSADALLIKHPLPSPNHVPSTTKATPETEDDPISAILGPKSQTAGNEKPLAVLNTRHAGQQALAVRSDGRIFATAGWDARVRVYAPQGAMREVAVLKWHQAGCYALAVADVGAPNLSPSLNPSPLSGGEREGEGSGAAVAAKGKGELSVREKRMRQAREGHWIAAGSKDGKVSLWDIY